MGDLPQTWKYEDICIYAARFGQLECLKWAKDHGCPWSEYTCTCAQAAWNGHLHILSSENGLLVDSIEFSPSGDMVMPGGVAFFKGYEIGNLNNDDGDTRTGIMDFITGKYRYWFRNIIL